MLSKNILYICRLCLSNIEKEVEISLLSSLVDLNSNYNNDTDRKLTISNIVMEVISIKLDENMNEVICKVCENKIIEFYKFKLQCELNDEQYKKLQFVDDQPKEKSLINFDNGVDYNSPDSNNEVKIETIELNKTNENQIKLPSKNFYRKRKSSEDNLKTYLTGPRKCNFCNVLILQRQQKAHFNFHLTFLKELSLFKVTTEDLVNNYTLCEICLKTFDSINNYFNHIKTHKEADQNSKIAQCCNIDFVNLNILNEHLKEKHPFLKQACFKCLKSNNFPITKWKSHLFEHSKEQRDNTSKISRCLICPEKRMTYLQLVDHVYTHFVDKQFETQPIDVAKNQAKCRFSSCSKIFSSSSCRNRHEKTIHHKSIRNNCEMNSNREMSNDIQNVDDDVLIENNNSFDNQNDIDEITNDGDDDKARNDQIRCDICSIPIVRKKQKVHFDNHLVMLKRLTSLNIKKEAILNSFTLCAICLKTFKSIDELNDHMIEGHDNLKNFNCCSKQFNDLNTFEAHVNKTHSFLKQLCLKCLKSFNSPKITLNVHYSKHLKRAKQLVGSLTNIAKCLVCTKKHMTYFELIDHMYTHFDLTYSCQICGIEFESGKDLETHNNLKHNDTNLGCCQFCGKSDFQTLKQLREHIWVHKQPKEPVQCDICKKMLMPRSLINHKLFHKGDYRHACTICGKKCLQSSNLKDHMRRKHSNEKPFKCTHCNKRFSANFARKVHERSHTNERPFQCQVCLKYLPYYTSVIRHRLMHSGEKPFGCTVCDKSYRDKSKRDMHMKKKHPNVPIPKRTTRGKN